MKKIIPVLVVIIVLMGAYKILTKNPNPPAKVDDAKADMILFWGEGCPHCKKVDEFITTNKYDQKMSISKKEVYYNKDNQVSLAQTVQKCPEIDTKQGIGVPLAYIPKDNKCLQGDQPIIDYIQGKFANH
ncbi:MAG TPA: hypothetical protein VF828_04795 [Patescibacteria group bacterium]